MAASEKVERLNAHDRRGYNVREWTVDDDHACLVGVINSM